VERSAWTRARAATLDLEHAGEASTGTGSSSRSTECSSLAGHGRAAGSPSSPRAGRWGEKKVDG
jgi:hypothetical protein